jgi:four helix bundle protein
MTEAELKGRTKRFAIDSIRFVRTLPTDDSTRVISKQFVRCATSVGANYRSACRAKSRADMIAKLRVVEEEADEAMYWLELLEETKGNSKVETRPLMNEAEQILRIIVASVKTLKATDPSGLPKSKI